MVKKVSNITLFPYASSKFSLKLSNVTKDLNSKKSKLMMSNSIISKKAIMLWVCRSFNYIFVLNA